MVYNVDIGNNDEYMGTLSFDLGHVKASQRYEYTCRFSDDGGSNWTWQGAGNGQLSVLGPSAITLRSLIAQRSNSWLSVLLGVGLAGVWSGALIYKRKK